MAGWRGDGECEGWWQWVMGGWGAMGSMMEGGNGHLDVEGQCGVWVLVDYFKI